MLAIQVAKLRGIRVIGTVSIEEKAAKARSLGCDEIIFYRREDVPARVKELTGGEGVQTVFDSVGKDTFEGSLTSLRRRAVSVGFRSHKQTPRATLPETDPRYSGRGYILADNELLELSVVTIPANPDAVAQRAAPDLLSALEARVRALEDAVTLSPSPAPSAKHRDPIADLFGLE